MWTEYRFRTEFPGLTHEEFLEEPGRTVDWLLAIAKLDREIEADRRRREDASR